MLTNGRVLDNDQCALNYDNKWFSILATAHSSFPNEPTPNQDCDSAIGQHLLDNDQCALNYDNKRFSILAAACSSFHLNLVEAAYIKTWCTVSCEQKECVYTLKLF